jgi:serine/threonine-protein kinase
VLVVPFQTPPTDPTQTDLGVAMADAIQVRLQSVFAGRVAQAVAPAPGEDPKAIGARLGTDAVITGAISQIGSTLKLSVELVRVSDGQRLTTMVGDADEGHLFALQDKAALHLALTLRPDLMPTERGPLARQDAANAAAYRLFIQARDQWRHRSREAVAEAIRLYEAAVQRDPRFVRAYAELAAAYATVDTRTDPLIALPKAKVTAERAVALSASSAQAHAALGLVRYRYEWRWKDAETEFTVALSADPRDVFTRHQHALFLHVTGRTNEAIAEFERALELEPDSPAIRADMVAPLLRAGRTADARAAVEAVYAIDPAWPTLDQLNADVFAAEGRVGESVASLWRALLARGVLAGKVDALRAAYRAGGVTAMLERRITQLTREVEDGPTPPSSYFLATELALAHASLKHRDQTLHWLAVAIDLREEAPMHMKASAAFDFVRTDPQFIELLRRAKLD